MNKKDLIVPLAVAGVVVTSAPKVLRVVAETTVVAVADETSGVTNGVSVTSRGLGEVIRVIGGEG